MEKRNSQLEHGQPIEQTRGLSCTCDSGVARCQSQHQYRYGPVSMAAVNQSVIHYEWLQKSNDSLKDCFENVKKKKFLRQK